MTTFVHQPHMFTHVHDRQTSRRVGSLLGQRVGSTYNFAMAAIDLNISIYCKTMLLAKRLKPILIPHCVQKWIVSLLSGRSAEYVRSYDDDCSGQKIFIRQEISFDNVESRYVVGETRDVAESGKNPCPSTNKYKQVLRPTTESYIM